MALEIFLSRYLPCGYISRDLVWCRLSGNRYGVCLKRTPPLFGERHGHQRTYRLGFGWRLEFLQPWRRW
jgi:hypothetical protein